MLTLRETGWGVYGNPLVYLCNFSVSLKLFQNKKFIKSLVFTQMSYNLMSPQNWHMDVYNSFIHNCQNLEATKLSFSRWMDK